MLNHLNGGPGTLATLFALGIVLAMLWIIVMVLLFLVIREENRSAVRRLA